MGLPNLYICHTAYQVLVELVRAMEDTVAPELILSSVIPNTEELAGRLSATGEQCHPKHRRTGRAAFRHRPVPLCTGF